MMQGDLSDLGGQVSHVKDVSAFIHPEKNAVKDFEQAILDSMATQKTSADNVAHYQPSSLDDVNSYRSSSAKNGKDLINWSVNSVYSDFNIDKNTLVDNVLEHGQGLSKTTQNALNEVLDFNKVVEPLLNHINKMSEGQEDKFAPLLNDELSPNERQAFVMKTMNESALQQVELNSQVLQIQSQMAATSVKYSFSLASYSWVKNIMTGWLKSVKSIVTNTR